MKEIEAPKRPGRRISQERAQRTYNALVQTAFRLLEYQEFDAITVAELSRQAGYSVGAFYARFNSKNELLDALIAQHIEERGRSRERVVAASSRDTLCHDLIEELVAYYWQRRQFWRAALLRGMRDPEFWKPLLAHAQESVGVVLEEISKQAGRKLTEDEQANVRFAFHVVLGAINNSIVNRPGPTLFLGQSRFVEHLARAFRLVSDYDALVGITVPAEGERKRA